jgi:hypothetical protein
MSFRSSLKLDSLIFSAEKRKAAGGRAVMKTAREFAKSVQDKMENSPHTGKTVTKAAGVGFSVRHQQSRRGQRPAPFTRNLLRSVKPKRINQVESVVEVGAEYAEHLVNLGRVIVSKSDLRGGQKMLDANAKSELKQLIGR